MSKADLIYKLEYLCREFNENGGIAEKDFYIHQKKRDSFKVRKGNYIEWANKDVLIICFTRFNEFKPNTSNSDSLIGMLFKSFAQSVVTDLQRNQEAQNAKKVKIPWFGIESIGG